MKEKIRILNKALEDYDNIVCDLDKTEYEMELITQYWNIIQITIAEIEKKCKLAKNYVK